MDATWFILWMLSSRGDTPLGQYYSMEECKKAKEIVVEQRLSIGASQGLICVPSRKLVKR